jgi:HKD family nuclease
MDFLFSNLSPVRTKYKTFADEFYSLIPKATRLDIAVGYVTAESLAELQQTIAYNKNIETLNLIIGMHYFDKFTKLEYNAAVGLNDFLRKEKRGEVKLVKSFRFHGKLYVYSNNAGAFAGIIGSNNLSSIVENRTRIYEAAALISEQEYAVKIKEFIDVLSVGAADNIADCPVSDSDFKIYNKLLEDHEYVVKLSNDEYADVLSSLSELKFDIPLIKRGGVPEKSNLNVFFGEGRLNRKKGVIIPRHWYEVELMVPNTITSIQGYPQKDTPSAVFDVVTDDSWKFSCKVSGDYSKNFRSEDNLKILGKWIKGRLENAGVLEVGHMVTEETFTRYGRDNFTLQKTDKPNLWFLDFGVNK